MATSKPSPFSKKSNAAQSQLSQLLKHEEDAREIANRITDSGWLRESSICWLEADKARKHAIKLSEIAAKEEKLLKQARDPVNREKLALSVYRKKQEAREAHADFVNATSDCVKVHAQIAGILK